MSTLTHNFIPLVPHVLLSVRDMQVFSARHSLQFMVSFELVWRGQPHDGPGSGEGGAVGFEVPGVAGEGDVICWFWCSVGCVPLLTGVACKPDVLLVLLRWDVTLLRFRFVNRTANISRSLDTVNYPKINRVSLCNKSWRCAYALYTLKTWF